MYHNHYTNQFKDLANYLKYSTTQSTKYQLTRAAKIYLQKYGPSYRGIHLSYPDMNMSMFAITQRKMRFEKGQLVECIFCDKGRVGKDYCPYCLGVGLIEKKQIKIFKKTCEKRRGKN